MSDEAKAKYGDYLRTPHWRVMRGVAMKRANGMCEQCQIAYADDVHHLTYERLGAENPEDIVALCRACHAKAHGKRVPAVETDIPSFVTLPAALAGDRLKGAERYMGLEERTPEEIEKVDRFLKEFRAAAGSLRSQNEIERGFQQSQPVKETPEQVLARVQAAGPVVLGPELAKKLESMGARFDSAPSEDNPPTDEQNALSG